MVQAKAKEATRHGVQIRVTDPSRVRGSATELLCPRIETDRDRQRANNGDFGWVLLDTKTAHASAAWKSELLTAGDNRTESSETCSDVDSQLPVVGAADLAGGAATTPGHSVAVANDADGLSTSLGCPAFLSARLSLSL